MSVLALTDETIWGLKGAKFGRSLPDAETFSTTPIIDLVRATATHRPEAIALVGQTASLRYGELLSLVRNVASAVARIVPPAQPIACLLPRSPEGAAGLVGCLVSGRLCMILDPSHPAQRQAALLREAAPAALMLTEPLPFAFPAPVLMLADALAGPDRDWQPDFRWNPDAPCAVFFTSGSSGQPKGIVLSARSILYRALDSAESLELTKEDRVFAPSVPIAGSGLSFLLAVLARGSRMVLSNIAAEGASAVLNLMEREAVTCAMIQPPVLRLLLQSERSRAAFRALRMLRIGAAGLPRADLAAWRPLLPPNCSVSHTYASTEALLVASCVVPPDDAGKEATVAAGSLHPNHEYALLGDDDRPVPPGHPGELVIRSRYVALGEWQKGQLTTGRMPPVPSRPGWRFFRTGDVSRLQANGLLRVIGRVDRQVKINGIRVEPAEIEAILRAEPGVSDAAIVATTTPEGIVLLGYVVAQNVDEAMLIKALRRRLAASLPSALRPARLVVLDRLPTLPSGKIDIMALSRGT
jgi:non-ribosomal peptide synthetase component F